MSRSASDYRPLLADAARAQGIDIGSIPLPVDHEVELNSLRFHYLDWGNPDRPPVVLLHGGRLTAHTWDVAALLLHSDYHLIALDQRGHGDSGRTPEADLERDAGELMLEDTRQFIDHLGYECVALVGMSMGGMNSIRYAARHPRRLSALGIVDVAPDVMRAGQVEMADFATATETLDRFEDFLERSQRFMPHRPVAHLRYSLHHSLRETEDGRYTWKYDSRPRPARTTDPHARAEELWSDVRAISTPTLLLRGAESKILSERTADDTVKAMHDARLVTVPRATHNVHSDNPVDFARALDTFLKDVLRG